eukprot:scaffold41652_cov71-Phaeocystis_antarctica.AAC.1
MAADLRLIRNTVSASVNPLSLFSLFSDADTHPPTRRRTQEPLSASRAGPAGSTTASTTTGMRSNHATVTNL